MDKSISTIKKDLTPLSQQALTLEINSSEALSEATSILSNLNKYLDSIIEYKEKKTKPLNEALKVIRAETKPYEKEIEEAIASIRSKMIVYQTNLVNTTKDQAQKIASRIGEGKGKLKLETAIEKLEALPDPLKDISTEEGHVQFREKKQLKVTDLSLIPDEYWMVNQELLLEDLKTGKEIPGAELETIQVPVNYR